MSLFPYTHYIWTRAWQYDMFCWQQSVIIYDHWLLLTFSISPNVYFISHKHPALVSSLFFFLRCVSFSSFLKTPQNVLCFFFLICVFIWLPQVLAAACGIFSCGMQALVPWPGIKLRLPPLRVRSLSPWTTWEVPSLLFGKLVLVLLLFLLHRTSMPLAIYRAELSIHCCLTNYSKTYFQTASMYCRAVSFF